MAHYNRRLNPYIRRMAEDMQVRNLARSTIKAYTYHVDKFCRSFGRSAEQLGPEEIRQYQLYLVNEKKASWSLFNLSGMMHLSGNLLRERDLIDSDRRLALDSAMFSVPAPRILPQPVPRLPP